MLPRGGFWSWKLELESDVDDNGAVRLTGALKVKLLVGGFMVVPIEKLDIVGVGVMLPQTENFIYIILLNFWIKFTNNLYQITYLYSISFKNKFTNI